MTAKGRPHFASAARGFSKEDGMRGTRYLIPALLVGTGIFAACASDTPSQPQGTESGTEDWGDQNLYPELGGKHSEALTAFNGTCAWVSTSGTINITSNGAQTAIIGLRAADSVFLINGALCNATSIKGSAIKKINFTGTTSTETLIVDYIGGVFAAGTSSARGITVSFGASGSDVLKVRGTASADVTSFGNVSSTPMLNIANDKYPDIEVTSATTTTYSLSLAGGADIFNAQANTATGITTKWSAALTVFGGDGNDSLYGGDGSDTLKGGAGADTLIGAVGADWLYGETGNDVMDQGSAPDGADTMDCGSDNSTTAELDYAYYGSRTAAVFVNVDGTSNDGASGETDNVNSTCEVVAGGSGNDTLIGMDNTSLSFGHMLLGGLGNDTMDGKGGVDTLNGGDGDDTLYDGSSGASAVSGSDVFIGGNGTDLMDYSARSAALTVTMNGTAADDGESGEQDNVRADVENITGGTVTDIITGNDLDNVIKGGLGNDSLVGGKGNDTFDEGAVTSGSDVFIGGDGADLINYGSRTAALTVSMGLWTNVAGTTADLGGNDGEASEGDTVGTDVENVLTGTQGDAVYGNDLDNEITTGAGADSVFSFGGSDVIDTGVATDSLNDCGAGDDVSFYGGSNCEL